MKKLGIVVTIFIFTLLTATFTMKVYASCSYAPPNVTDASSCSPPNDGLCIHSDGTKACCSDEDSCNTTDTSGNGTFYPPSNPILNPSCVHDGATCDHTQPCCSSTYSCRPNVNGGGNSCQLTPGNQPDKCLYQAAGDCLSPSLPQACLYNMSYFCCSSRQACIDKYGGGAPQDHANPSQPTSTPKSGGGTDVAKCNDGTVGIQTAIGCIHVLGSPETFLGEILRWAVGVGSGIAFLLILYAGFMIMTSAGNPERLKAGQELLTSALSGLILLVLSVFILKFIGVDILGLGTFGFGK